jgi:hypothetical protein
MATRGRFVAKQFIHSLDLYEGAIYAFASQRGRIYMSNDAYRTVLNQAQRFSTDEQFRLIEDLVVMLKKKSRRQHSISELEGLGKEVWEGVDVDEYIRQSRGSWDE